MQQGYLKNYMNCFLCIYVCTLAVMLMAIPYWHACINRSGNVLSLVFRLHLEAGFQQQVFYRDLLPTIVIIMTLLLLQEN